MTIARRNTGETQLHSHWATIVGCQTQKVQTWIFNLVGVEAAPLLFISMEVLCDGMHRALRKAPGGPAS